MTAPRVEPPSPRGVVWSAIGTGFPKARVLVATCAVTKRDYYCVWCVTHEMLEAADHHEVFLPYRWRVVSHPSDHAYAVDRLTNHKQRFPAL